MWPLPRWPQTNISWTTDMQDSMDAIEEQLQAVEDALFDNEEGSKEHKKLTARYERLKEEKKLLLTQEGRPHGSHVGASDHLLK